MAKPKGLGKGLDALFGDGIPPEDVRGLKLNDIEPNPHQPRQVFDESALSELAESIRQNGVIMPIAVRQTGETYQIIAGERRWRASRMAGLKTIPAVVLDVDVQTAKLLTLVENLQREDLNPLEEAEGYRQLMEDLSLTQEQAAERVGKSRSAVANAVRLLGLPEAIKSLLSDGMLTGGHARALLPIGDEVIMEDTAQKVLAQGLNVRQTEELARRLSKMSPDPYIPPSPDAIYVRELESRLTETMGRKVIIRHGAKKGKLSIEYFGNEDLEQICQALQDVAKHKE